MDREMSNDRDADFSRQKPSTKSSLRIQYARDELLLYRDCALARTRPVGLPKGLGMILDQNPGEGPCGYEMQTKAPGNKKSGKRAKQQKSQSTYDSSTKPPASNETKESTTAPDVVVHKSKQTKNQLSDENDISTKAASEPDIPKSIPQNEGIVESKRLTETVTACSEIGEVSSARNEREAQTIEPKSRKKKKRTKKQRLALEKDINTKAESKPDIHKSNARNEKIIESKRFTDTIGACDIGEVPYARNERETHIIEPKVRKNTRTKNQGVAAKNEMHSKAERKTEILESDVQNEGIIENKRRLETLGACSKEDGVPEESVSFDDPVVYSENEEDQGRINNAGRLLKSRTKDTINPSEFENSHVGKNTHSNARDDIYCDNCTDEKEPAASFCTICNDFLCQICSKVHQRSKLSRHHQLIHGDDMPKEKLYKFDENTCDTHKGELRNMLCNQHKKLLCTVCVALHHKHCKVEYIPDIAKDFAESNEYKDLNKELITMIKEMGNYKQMISKNISAIEKSPTRLLQQVSQFRVRINKVFDRIEHTTLNHLYSALTKYAEAFKQAHNTCSELETEVGDVLSKLERLENSQPVALVFLAKQVETRKKNYDKTLEDVGSTATERKLLKFFPNQQILEHLESFSDFGTFELEQNDIVEEELHTITADVGSGRIVHGEDFNVQHPSDVKDCWITGTAVIGEDKLALVDRNNSSLKIVHIQQRKITSMLKLQIPARDIAKIDRQNFVITCGSRLVLVHHHSRYLTTIDREIVVGGCTYGVACHRDLIYVSDITQPQLIKVVNMEGVVVKTISLESVLGLPVLPKYISVTVDGKSIVLTDRNIVMCLNNNKIGPIELKLKSPFLLMDASLDIDLTDLKTIGLFLFAGMSVARIDREIVPLVELYEKPQTVCYCQKKGVIYVSFEQGSKKANVISVFYSLPNDDI